MAAAVPGLQCNLVQACINLFAEFDARTEDDEPVVDATPVERLREVMHVHCVAFSSSH